MMKSSIIRLLLLLVASVAFASQASAYSTQVEKEIEAINEELKQISDEFESASKGDIYFLEKNAPKSEDMIERGLIAYELRTSSLRKALKIIKSAPECSVIAQHPEVVHNRLRALGAAKVIRAYNDIRRKRGDAIDAQSAGVTNELAKIYQSQMSIMRNPEFASLIAEIDELSGEKLI